MSRLNLGDSLILNSDYSTSEVKTGATWIDGKPIYRKVHPMSCPATAGTYTSAHNISNLEKIVKYDAIVQNTIGETKISPFIYYGSLNWAFCVGTDNANVVIQLGADFASNFGGSTVYTTIYYTKTTD